LVVSVVNFFRATGQQRLCRCVNLELIEESRAGTAPVETDSRTSTVSLIPMARGDFLPFKCSAWIFFANLWGKDSRRDGTSRRVRFVGKHCGNLRQNFGEG